MEPGPILACGAMNLDEIHRVPREEMRRFFGDAVPSGGEVVLRDGLDGILAWLPTHGRFVGRFPGGSAANTAVALSRLGLPVAFCGMVGEDEAGAFLLSRLEGVDGSRVERGGLTGRCVILVDEEGERTILKAPGANNLWEPPRDTRPPAGGWAGLHLTSLSVYDGPVRQEALAAAAGEDLPVTFDPGELYASRGAEEMAPLLRRCTVLFLNRREIRLLYGKRPLDTQLLESPRVAVIVKDGREGLEVISGGGRIRIPAVPVAAVDTTGAGDATAAGFLAGLRRGWPLSRCGRLAALCGALATTMPGREGYPDGRVYDAVDEGIDGLRPSL